MEIVQWLLDEALRIYHLQISKFISSKNELEYPSKGMEALLKSPSPSFSVPLLSTLCPPTSSPSHTLPTPLLHKMQQVYKRFRNKN